ncbi:MAG: Na/Pi symporter, partial [Deltaproteobacteria bacterium]|nr:Na/Pi symporter [Deltaproteobacteria bacterium]
MTEFSWLVLLGGLTFFFFGLTYARRGLQSLAGDRMRLAIAHLTGNRFAALGTGALITVVLQSSTATILMLMSLASTGLLSLTQAFGVILGADIGTTLVVILISIKKISDYALLLVILGFFLEWVFKNSKGIYYTGRVLFGFGLIFYGMKLMTATAAPLAGDPNYQILFGVFE